MLHRDAWGARCTDGSTLQLPRAVVEGEEAAVSTCELRMLA
jgi:hypothetical protein